MRADQDRSSRARHLAVKKVPVAEADTSHRLTVQEKAGTQQPLAGGALHSGNTFWKN
jgi:hypothetical protein